MHYCVCVCVFQCIDKARDLLDAELTAMAGESYSRAYGVRLYCLFNRLLVKNLQMSSRRVVTLNTSDQWAFFFLFFFHSLLNTRCSLR